MKRLTNAIADPYSSRSLSGATRARRWKELQRRFPDFEDMRVVDLGGDVNHWAHAPVLPRELVIVNLFAQAPTRPGMKVVVGDACAMAPELEGERFDLAYSNSVIEHVGGHARREGFADVASRLADRMWQQTPYRFFPIEPHWVCPGFQFLPTPAKVRVTQHWPLGHRRRSDRTQAIEEVLTVELLSRTEMQHYFPTAEIWTERVAGLVKSLVAVKE